MKPLFLTFALLFCSLTTYAALRSPKTMVVKPFSPAGAPEFTITFDGKLDLAHLTGSPTAPKPGSSTSVCEIGYYNSKDKALRYNNHAFLQTDVKVTLDGQDYFITPAYGSRYDTAFGSAWNYCTTIVYENSADCFAQQNAIRILIGVYANSKPVYTNREDFKIGWERDTDKVIIFGKDGMSYAGGKVVDWY